MNRCRRQLVSCCAVAWLAVTAGCYKATFYQNPQVTSGDQHEEWTDFFLFGLVGNQSIEVGRYCPPNSVAVVRTGANAGTGFVSVITLGIYTPHKVYVTCAAPARAEYPSAPGPLAKTSSSNTEAQ
jgi:hypothetical protein